MTQGKALASSVVCLLASCAPAVVEGPPFAMDFARASSFYDAPFPSDDLVVDGKVHVDIANANDVAIVDSSLALITRDAHGFSQAGAIYLRAGAALDVKSLPADVWHSIDDDASVFLVSLPLVPGHVVHHPVEVAYLDDGGPFGDAHLLAILPLQGAPLLAHTTYAAVVRSSARYVDGSAPSASPALATLRANKTPRGMSDDVAHEYRAALDALAHAGVDDVAALTVFTTDDRAPDVTAVRADALAHHAIAAPAASSMTLTDTFDGYCVFQSTISVPVYQHGVAPYSSSGGDWHFDEANGGAPIFDHAEQARIFVTVPRTTAMPSSGWPTVVFIGTGAGGDRALVDRGVCSTAGFGTADKPGTGPAQEFARVGWAGVQIDGDLEGIRNIGGGNEDLNVFNVFNPPALRDNVRQSALEISLLPSMLASLQLDASSCAGASASFSVDHDKLALMGHSMGAWIAPLVLASEPAFKTAILSGAGASYVENIMDKQLPLAVRPIAEELLGYSTSGRKLTPFDPALTIFQWAQDPSDAQIYDVEFARQHSGRNVLMLQGIVDHYILPTIANATSLAMGLDLAGPPLDDNNAELRALGDQVPLAKLLPLVGQKAVALPAAGDDGATTGIVVQNPGDAIEDGHEVNFQTATPKSEYRCFLDDVAKGKVPTVRAPSSTDACYTAQ
jgi:hypothetical protein